MKITSVEFIKSVENFDHIPKDNLKEVAFAGRSNVGKSSLINCLLNRKKIARTSSTPGKTRQLNYFKINQKIYFVDLPGYGFAKAPKTERVQWRRLIENFLTQSPNLKGVVSIIDSRIGPTKLDLQLLEWLKNLNIPIILVATKSDKLSKSALLNQVRKYLNQLNDFKLKQIIPFSAINGAGKKEVWREITTLLEH
ncbi:YihA family ribosome biogenesis GTP-binding protein [candidate division KSB1 bacterium]|nr:YihA family ribosome biogenesis GTP-binding protein [candidate division KSB1 bacterium]